MVYYIKALYLSLFSKGFYIDLITNRKFTGIVYIFLISILISIPSSLRFNREIADVFDYNSKRMSAEKYVESLNSQFPETKYNNGVFEFDVSEQQVISFIPENDFIVIDPKNEINDYSKFPDAMIFKSDKLVYNNDNRELQVFSASQLFESLMPYFMRSDNGNIFDHKRFFNDLAAFLNFSYPVLFFLITAITAIKYLIWVFLFTNLAYLIFLAKYKPFILPSRTLFRVCSFSATPVALFEIIRVMFQIEYLFYYPVIISVIINVIYLNYIINSLKLIPNSKT